MSHQSTGRTEPREEEQPPRPGCARRARRTRVGGLAVAAALTALIAMPGSAQANPYGNEYVDSTGWITPYPDDGTHTWYADQLALHHELAMDYAMETRLEATDLTVTKITPQSIHTDVIARDSGFGPSGWLGRWTCWNWNDRTYWDYAINDWNVERLCDRGYLEINQDESPAGCANDGCPNRPYAHNSKVTCHEAGHSAGLIHAGTTDSCMWYAPYQSSTSDFNTHDKGHINGRF